MRRALALSLCGLAAGCGGSSGADAGTRFDGFLVGEPTLTASPTAGAFPAIVVGETSAPLTFILANLDFAPTGPVSAGVDSWAEFVLTTSSCGQSLRFQETCQASAAFRPVSAGPKTGRLTFTVARGESFQVWLSGTAWPPDGGVDAGEAGAADAAGGGD